MRRRVAITGVGLVSCLGHDYEEVLKALSEALKVPLDVLVD